MKFGRIYSMYIEGQTDSHTINFPLTCKLQVITNSLYSAGSATFMIYNLAEDVRNDLYKDAFAILVYKKIVFAAGYQADSSSGGITLPIIFKGNVTLAYSYRQGPDWITEIHALDGGYMMDNASINLTKPAPYNFDDLMKSIVATMAPFGLSLGAVGSFDLTGSRGITFSGSPWDLITQTIQPLQGEAFINKEKVYIMQQWEVIADTGLVDTISNDTGLVGTPMLQDALVKARMIFEPRLEVGQQVQLYALQTRMRGQYKVLSLVHSGTISGAVCENLLTEATLYQPERNFEVAA